MLVTGGAGFIGSHLADALVERGARVRVLDNLATGLADEPRAISPAAIELLEGDLRELGGLPGRLPERRLRFPPGGARLGAALDRRPGHQPGRQRRRHRQPAGRRPRRRGAAGWSTPAPRASTATARSCPKKEGQEGSVLSPYAMSKKMCEELAEIFGRCYGARAGRPALLQRLRPAPAARRPLRRGHSALLRRRLRRRGAAHLRQRRPEPRLHVRGRRGGRQPARRRRRPEEPAAAPSTWPAAGGPAWSSWPSDQRGRRRPAAALRKAAAGRRPAFAGRPLRPAKPLLGYRPAVDLADRPRPHRRHLPPARRGDRPLTGSC